MTFHQPGPVYPRDVQEIFAAIRPDGVFAIGNARLSLIGLHSSPGGPATKPAADFALDVTCDGNGKFAITDRDPHHPRHG